MDGLIVPVNYVDQIKTIKLVVPENQVEWNYDPVLNFFMMSINVDGNITFATDGFWQVNRVVEQDVNGVQMAIPVLDTYYFDKEGKMLTGWIHTIDDKWYYMEHTKVANEGQMFAVGWKKIQNIWYYFTSDGSMLVNSMTPDGYIVGADGAWIQ